MISARPGTPYTLAADVYAYGMVLYNIMTLHRPFETIKQLYGVHELVQNGAKPYLPPAVREAFLPLLGLYEACTASVPTKRPTFAQIVKHLLSLQNPAEKPTHPVPRSISAGEIEFSLPVDINAVSDKGWTALHTASADGDMDVRGSLSCSRGCVASNGYRARRKSRNCSLTTIFKSISPTMKEPRLYNISCEYGSTMHKSEWREFLRDSSRRVRARERQ